MHPSSPLSDCHRTMAHMSIPLTDQISIAPLPNHMAKPLAIAPESVQKWNMGAFIIKQHAVQLICFFVFTFYQNGGLSNRLLFVHLGTIFNKPSSSLLVNCELFIGHCPNDNRISSSSCSSEANLRGKDTLCSGLSLFFFLFCIPPVAWSCVNHFYFIRKFFWALPSPL